LPTAEQHAAQIKAQLGKQWLPSIYRDCILKIRTRSYQFESSKPGLRVTVQHTLLGVELKVGKRRLLCPDLATARYLGIFARIGCSEVAMPYDITRISQWADELDSSWHRMLLLADHATANEAVRKRIRSKLVAAVRDEIAVAGAGTRIPEFKQSTRQRR